MNKAKWVHIGNKKHRDMLGRTKDINVINKVINMHRKRKSCQEADKRGLLKKNEQCSREVKWSFAFLFFFYHGPPNTLWVINRPWLTAKTRRRSGPDVLLTLSLAKQRGWVIDQPASHWNYGAVLSLGLETHTRWYCRWQGGWKCQPWGPDCLSSSPNSAPYKQGDLQHLFNLVVATCKMGPNIESPYRIEAEWIDTYKAPRPTPGLGEWLGQDQLLSSPLSTWQSTWTCSLITCKFRTCFKGFIKKGRTRLVFPHVVFPCLLPGPSEEGGNRHPKASLNW